MSKLRFFTDAHIPKQVAIQLKNRNIDVLRCQDVGLDNATDEELLAYAVENDYTMLTLDDDFPKLHLRYIALDIQHTGIFYGAMNQFQGQVGSIVAFCAIYAELIENGAGTLEDDIHNQLIYIQK